MSADPDALVDIPEGIEPGQGWTCKEGCRHFICWQCKGVYTSNEDFDSEAEAVATLGEMPPENERVCVCDDCYPELVAWAKEQGLIPQ